MAVLKVYEPPAEVLRKIAEPVDQVDDELRQLMDDMVETMEAEVGIGLAAPQVGVSKRVIVIDLQDHWDHDGPMFLVNPVIVKQSEEMSVYKEGCLSVPGQYADVERPATVSIEYLDYNGDKQTLDADELLATCVQHEIDHLNGVLFIDHLSKMKRDMLLKKLKKSQKIRGI